MYETETISKCCQAPVEYEQAGKSMDQKIPYCYRCKKHCETEERCAICKGSGTRTVPGRVYPNEPHMADVDEVPCFCKTNQ